MQTMLFTEVGLQELHQTYGHGRNNGCELDTEEF